MKTRSVSLLVTLSSKKAMKKRQQPKINSKKSSSSLSNKSATTSKKSTSAATEYIPWFSVFTKEDDEYLEYMTTEWGFEKRGDEPLFEKISLEGAQSGLSWLTILRKRDAYRRVFHNFDIDKVAAMQEEDIDRILQEEDEDKRNIIVRHRGKVESVINNAKCIQKLRLDRADRHENSPHHGAFDEFLWSFVDNKPVLNVSWKGGLKEAISQSPESKEMSKALKKLGFRFVGPTTCYSMMQSCGLVLDHPVNSLEWKAAYERLQSRPDGYQER